MVFLPVIIFVLGLVVGSFLNVVILRINTGRSFVSGRSICPHCSRTLTWHELIPVFSFLALRGKCRTCRAPISFQYPVVELLTAILFVIFYIKFPLIGGFSALSWLAFLFSLIVASFFIVIAVYDVRHKIVPDKAVYPLMVLAILSAVVKVTLMPTVALGSILIGGVLVALPFFMLWFFSKGRLMGFGDVKLALAIGWLLGAPRGFGALLLAFWIGAIFGLLLLGLSRRHSMKSEVPFAPFLILGTLISVLWGITFGTFFPLWS